MSWWNTTLLILDKEREETYLFLYMYVCVCVWMRGCVDFTCWCLCVCLLACQRAFIRWRVLCPPTRAYPRSPPDPPPPQWSLRPREFGFLSLSLRQLSSRLGTSVARTLRETNIFRSCCASYLHCCDTFRPCVEGGVLATRLICVPWFLIFKRIAGSEISFVSKLQVDRGFLLYYVLPSFLFFLFFFCYFSYSPHCSASSSHMSFSFYLLPDISFFSKSFPFL